MGAGFPGRPGAPARRHHTDRGIGEHPGIVLRAGRRRADPLLPAERESRGDDLRRLRLHPRPVSYTAGVRPERLRAGASPPRPTGRLPRPAGRRAGHRSLQADPRRALRPGQGPLRRRAVHPGRRGARAAVWRLHAPRRHRQGRRADAAPDRDPRGPAPQDRPVLRGGQGEVARAVPQLRPVARDRRPPIATSRNTSGPRSSGAA